MLEDGRIWLHYSYYNEGDCQVGRGCVRRGYLESNYMDVYESLLKLYDFHIYVSFTMGGRVNWHP